MAFDEDRLFLSIGAAFGAYLFGFFRPFGTEKREREKERKREREKEKRKQRSKETVKEILCRALLRILCDLFSSWSSSEVKKNVYVNKRLERNRRENV